MNNRRKGLRNIISSIASQLTVIAFGLVLPRMFIVSYGSEVNGLLTSLSQLLVYLGLFEAGVGAATLQALYRPVAEGDWDKISRVLSATDRYYRRTGRWYLFALLTLTFLYPLVVSSELSYGVVAGTVFFSGIGNVVVFYFQGKYNFLLQAEGKNYIYTNLTTLISILTSLSKVILIALGANVVLILAASFCVHLIQMAYILWYIRRNYPKLRLDVPPDMAAISQRNYALVHQVSTLIFNNTDVLILTVVCGLKIVSVYSMFKLVTSNLENILRIFPNSLRFVLGQTYQTDLALYTHRSDLFEACYAALTYAVFSVALFLFLPFMALYTAGVTDVNYVDGKLAALFVAASLLNLSRTCPLMAIDFAGHFRQTMGRSILESGLNLTVSILCVFRFGIYGVLWGTIAALAYRTNDIILYANHVLLHRSAWRSYAVYGVDLALLLGLQGVFRLLFPAEIASYGQLIAIGFGTTALALVVFAVSLLLHPAVRQALREWLRSR